MNTQRLVLLIATAALLLAFFGGPNPYAVDITTLNPGVQAAGDPFQMISYPEGEGLYNGSSAIYQLGVGGQVTLELGDAAADGFGTDLIIYENPFLVIGGTNSETWAELLTVEVSSNNFDWAAFPTDFGGNPGPFGLFQGLPMHWYRGFAGVSPVSADPSMGIDPADVVSGGGDVFDFADLLNDPAVLAELVDLQDIRFVRLTDVVAGTTTDTAGNFVWDCGDPSFSCADIDAIYSANSPSVDPIGRPWVELSMEDHPGGTFMILEIGDPNGLGGVIPGITVSANGVQTDFFSLLHFFNFLELDKYHVRMAAGPVIPQLPRTQFRVSVTDFTGKTSGDAIYFP